MDKKWMAIYTKPRCEKKVALRLEQKGITAYCPLQKKVSQWHDRKKLIEEPVIRSYVFVYVAENERINVLQTDQVISFVFWNKKPAIIRDEEIIALKKFLNDYESSSISIEDIRFMPNEEVLITSGVFMDNQAKVIEQRGKKVKLSIGSLGICLTATLPLESISKKA